jgi:hypothetical protein
MTDQPDPPDRDRDAVPEPFQGDSERVRRGAVPVRDGDGDDGVPRRRRFRRDTPAFGETEHGAAIGGRIRELTGGIEAPATLRARVEAERARAAVARRSGWRPRLAIPVAASALAAVVLALVLVLSGGGPAGPSVDDAAALALARPTAAAPAVDGTDTARVDARIAGLQFPNYTYAWPRWRTAGQRRDTIDGRAATTVTYRGPRGAVGYTIVDGAALPEPGGARHVTANGTRFAVLRKGGATIVTWRRDGHTCVLAGRGAGVERQLLAFASWA